MKRQAKRVDAVPIKEAYAEHCRWWAAFWQRSWIVIEARFPKDEKAASLAHGVSQGYALQRFLLACGGRGAYPMKFNGSIFNVCGSGYDADYRLWGGPYWFQNTRLVYWPLLASGDADLLQPFFAMYRDILPLAERRTRIYYGHEGVFFPETMHFWGVYHNSNYGWGQKKELGLTDNTYIRRYWQGGLELVMMMLDYYDITGDKVFLHETLLPIGTGVIAFFDRHWPRDAEGKIRFEPAQALETYHAAVNPLPEIAGLRAILPRMLALPHDGMADRQRQAWTRFLGNCLHFPCDWLIASQCWRRPQPILRRITWKIRNSMQSFLTGCILWAGRISP